MKRQVVSEELPQGVWLRLDCGHKGRPGLPAGGEVNCEMCDLRQIPTDVEPGRRTPTFDGQSVPAGLLAAHKTSVWARLVVTRGTVTFVDEQPAWRACIEAPRSIVIVPDRLHHVEPGADAEFHVQFYSHPFGASRLSRQPAQ